MRRPTLLVPLLVLALLLAAGGAGAARPTCGGRPATKWKPDVVASDGVAWFFADAAGRDVIVGTNGPDQVEGSTGGDLVCTRDGDDTVNAYGGDDRVWAGPGADTVAGHEGDDALKGGPGADTLTDEAGPANGLPADADRLYGGPDGDTINVADGDGDDTVCSGESISWDGAAGDQVNPASCP